MPNQESVKPVVNEKLMKIIDKVWNNGQSCGGLSPYNPKQANNVKKQAHDQIIELFRECLPKKVWVVGIGDCEGNRIVAICTTKELAEKELFKARDELVKDWKESVERLKKEKDDFADTYKEMIEALSGNDYEKWDNYPHDVPYLYETEVITEAEKKIGGER